MTRSELLVRLLKCELAAIPSTLEIANDRFRFRTAEPITLAQLNLLSAEFCTDRINFSLGQSGYAAYSEDTPGWEGESGYVEVWL